MLTLYMNSWPPSLLVHRPDKVLRSFTDSLLPREPQELLKDHACLATDTTKQ